MKGRIVIKNRIEIKSIHAVIIFAFAAIAASLMLFYNGDLSSIQSPVGAFGQSGQECLTGYEKLTGSSLDELTSDKCSSMSETLCANHCFNLNKGMLDSILTGCDSAIYNEDNIMIKSSEFSVCCRCS